MLAHKLVEGFNACGLITNWGSDISWAGRHITRFESQIVSNALIVGPDTRHPSTPNDILLHSENSCLASCKARTVAIYKLRMPKSVRMLHLQLTMKSNL